MKKTNARKLVFSALLLSLGYLLPFFTGQIPTIGRALLPMHIPVLLAGFIVGPYWAGLIGLVLPLTSNFLFASPPINIAIPMTFELAAYGILAGLLYKLLIDKPLRLPLALAGALLGGRIVWAVASFIYLRLSGSAFTFELFLTGGFVGAIPGIILQLILIPVVVLSLEKAKLIGERND